MKTMIIRNDTSCVNREIRIYLLVVFALLSTTIFSAPRIASVSGNWNNTNTWGGESVPSISDDVTINSGVTVFINFDNAVCQSLRINNNVEGTASVFFSDISSKLLVNGVVTLSGNTINCNGTLSMANGGYLECNSISLGGGNAVFSPGTGTLQMNAVNSFPLSVVNNLIIRNGLTTLTRNLIIQGDLTIDLGPGYAGQIDVTTNNYSVSIAGNWFHKNPSDGFIERLGTVTFNGVGNQIFTSYGLYNNVVVNKPSGVVLFRGWVAPATVNNILEIYGNLTITSGVLRIDENATRLSIRGNLNISGELDMSKSDITNPGNRTVLGGILTLSANGILRIGGTNTFPANYSTISLSPTSTVEYCGTNQTVRGGITYGNLHITNSGTKTLASNCNVAGNIIVNQGNFNTGVRRITCVGSLNQTFFGVSLYDITIQKSNAGVLLSTETSVSNNITLTQGIVDATQASLVLLENATVLGASNISHVMGVVKKITNSLTEFIFPIGDGQFYRPISIVNPSNNIWSAQYFFSGYGNTFTVNPTDNPKLHHVSDIEYWDISPQLPGGSSKIKLTWNINSDVLYPEYLLIAHWNSNQNYWENVGDVIVDEVSQTITSVLPFSSFSPFTFGSTHEENPLPIELIRIDGYCDNFNKIHISWTTASEKNNELFTVYKSSNGILWHEIGTLKGAGNSNEQNTYSFIDSEKVDYFAYYKIIQTDFGGTKQELDLMCVFCQKVSHDISLIIHPLENELELCFFNFNDTVEPLNVYIYNQQGKLIDVNNFTAIPNYNEQRISLSEINAEGVYIIQIKRNNSIVYSASFLKKKSVESKNRYIAEIQKIGF